MLDTIVTSKTRIKLLIKFFLNSATSSYLRDLEQEFGDSTNGIRLELNRFEEAGMLVSRVEGNKKIFKANTKHPLFSDIHNILLKMTGIDQVIDKVLSQIGGLEQAWLVGDFARGRDSKIIELVLVGADIIVAKLDEYVAKAESLINRQISYTIFPVEQADEIAEKFPERLKLMTSD
jgi:hypothetical protein